MNQSPDKQVTRRGVLRGLSLAAITTSGISVFAADNGKARSAHNHSSFATTQELRNDSSLKVGDIVRTSGYYHPGDGGQAEYVIRKESDAEIGSIILKSKMVASLINVSSVNYKMFGAVGDGKNDDGVQVKLAHTYCNQHDIPINNNNGEFWIKQTTAIPILTNVEWGNTIFHIDEKFNTSSPRFEVSNKKPSIDIELSASQKHELIKFLKPGTSIIPMLAAYSNCLIIVEDKNDKIGIRSGASYKGLQSKPRSDFFYVEEHGRITGDIAWEFKDYTDLVAIPAAESFLTISGGTFYLSGNNSGKSYLKNGFVITRSRTIIKNQWVGLEPGKTDEATSARSGFYTFSKVYNVLLENVRLIPYVTEREGLSVNMSGTYGLGAGHMLCGTFRNVTAEGGYNHWGVFGTNLIKNFRVENCNLNRVDVHFHCWNLHIKDSAIGFKGIAITGGGQLIVENSSCASTSFINFRRDYGSKWDGDIRISNCRFFPSASHDDAKAILSYFPMDFDYKYPIGMGRSIIVENFEVDYTGNDSKAICWLIKAPQFSKAKHGERVFFPNYIEFRNVRVVGRESGLRLMIIMNPQVLNTRKKGGYDGVQLESNSRIVFNNIQLEKLQDSDVIKDKEAHFLIERAKEVRYEDEYALYPEIEISACKNLAADFGGNIAVVSISDCSVTKIVADTDGVMPGKISLSNTVLQPEARTTGDISLSLATELGTSLTNCTVHSPRINGVLKPELFDSLKFIKLNKAVQFHHVNTILGNDILNYIKAQGITLKPEFISMLKSHHSLESENVA
ncbi:MAG TPA: hypothetical protein VGD22_09630 [Sphingobacteriaceae bacterium]